MLIPRRIQGYPTAFLQQRFSPRFERPQWWSARIPDGRCRSTSTRVRWTWKFTFWGPWLTWRIRDYVITFGFRGYIYMLIFFVRWEFKPINIAEGAHLEELWMLMVDRSVVNWMFTSSYNSVIQTCQRQWKIPDFSIEVDTRENHLSGASCVQKTPCGWL